MARSHQPGLIVVDRAVPGRFENYRTPEQEIPERPPDYVWETCMTMATSWSYVPDDTYKPAGRLIELLVDIVAKGGNFLLNIGPAPDGTLPPAALDRLAEIGRWMKVNGSAIYGTRPVPPYAEGNARFTRGPSGIVNVDPARRQSGIGQEIRISAFRPKPGTTITLLGSSASLTWETDGEGLSVRIPEPARTDPPCGYAWTLQFTPE